MKLLSTIDENKDVVSKEWVEAKGYITNSVTGNFSATGNISSTGYSLSGESLTNIFSNFLGASTAGENLDLNDVFTPGIYRCYPTTLHKPDAEISNFASYGFCVVVKSYDWWYQIYVGNWLNNGQSIATRVSTDGTTWASWSALLAKSIYSGTTDPTSALGSDGDIYIKIS